METGKVKLQEANLVDENLEVQAPGIVLPLGKPQRLPSS
jgi:hypothetical protein